MKGSWTTDWALLTLRLSGLGLSLAHGWPKLQRFLAGEAGPFVEGVERLGFPFPYFFAWAATITELVGGVAIALGLLTRIASAFAAFTVGTAAFLRHRLAEQTLGFFGLLNVSDRTAESWGSPERAAVYLLIFLALILLGAGRFSLDRLVRRS